MHLIHFTLAAKMRCLVKAREHEYCTIDMVLSHCLRGPLEASRFAVKDTFGGCDGFVAMGAF